jgi:ATP-binding cassette subfamily B protein
MKERLLVGALRLTPEATRGDGVGMHLARALESDALQVALIGGALQGAMSLLELLAAIAVAWSSAGGALLALLIALWTAGGAALVVYYARLRREWTSARLVMTNHTVERLVGHTTRIVQESRGHWHVDEDSEMASYFERSVSVDRLARWITTLSARGFFLASLALIVPLLASTSLSPSTIGAVLGAVLLAQRAFAQLGTSATSLVDVAVGWQALGELFASAGNCPALPLAPVIEAGSSSPHESDEARPLVEARAVSFHYAGRARVALQDASVAVFSGDRVLIEGGSGGGKSTLTALLSGIRDPSTGLVFAGGLDRATLGESGWRRRVVAAPQFHENHIFSGTFAFNVLLGRRWPASEEQIADAEVLCRKLRLGALLDRMPAGMRTMVGESGWQLSHGERSRVFMARALLQRADVTVFDETFGALDPETLADCLVCAMEQSDALVVVAHP